MGSSDGGCGVTLCLIRGHMHACMQLSHILSQVTVLARHACHAVVLFGTHNVPELCTSVTCRACTCF